MADTILKDADYQKILDRRFGKNFARFIKAIVKPLSQTVQGFMGEHYKLELNYENNGKEQVVNFFIKTKPKSNLVQLELTIEMNLYQVEIFIYSVLLREYERYGFDTSFAPKCWYTLREETLVMEDLGEKGFTLPELGKWFDLEQSKCALKSLALMHATSVMYEETKSKELGRKFVLGDEYYDIFKERIFTYYTEFRYFRTEEWYKEAIQMFCLMIDELPESEEYKMEFKDKLQNRDLGKIFVQELGLRKTVSHGDLWSNNLFFKYENNVPTHCFLLDYQMSRYFYPSYDVMIFLYANTDHKFYSTQHPYLIKYYYDTLSEIFTERGYNISDFYPEEEFKKSLDFVEFETKVLAYNAMALVNLQKNTINEAMKQDESFSKLVFDDRIQISINAMKNDEHYRKLMIGNLYSFHDCLFKN